MKIHLLPTNLYLRLNETSDHILFLVKAANSCYMASFHFSDLRAEVTEHGLVISGINIQGGAARVQFLFKYSRFGSSLHGVEGLVFG